MNGIPQTVIEQLHHPDRSKRSKAVFALDRLDSPDKLPILIQALRSEADLFIREDITFAIMHMGAHAVPALIELLQDTNPQIRHHAAHVLGKISDASAVDALMQVLQDADATVVSKAAMALTQINDQRAIPALAKVVGHPDPNVKTAIRNALDHFGAKAVPTLLTALQANKWQVREQAADILGVIADERATPALIEALRDEQWQVRFAAVTALSHIGGPAAYEALQQMPTDANSRVNEGVATLLKRIAITKSGPSTAWDYHLLKFADTSECSAFIAGLSRFLNHPTGSTYRAEANSLEIWSCPKDLQEGIILFLSDLALNATIAAFGQAAVLETRKGNALSAHCAFIMGGQQVEPWSMLDAKKHLLKSMLRR